MLHNKLSILKQQPYLFCSQICNVGRTQWGQLISDSLSLSWDGWETGSCNHLKCSLRCLEPGLRRLNSWYLPTPQHLSLSLSLVSPECQLQDSQTSMPVQCSQSTQEEKRQEPYLLWPTLGNHTASLHCSLFIKAVTQATQVLWEWKQIPCLDREVESFWKSTWDWKYCSGHIWKIQSATQISWAMG